MRISPDAVPLKTHTLFMEQHSRELVDPVESLFETLSTGKSGKTESILWIHFRAAARRRTRRAELALPYIEGDFRFQFAKRAFLKNSSTNRLLARVVNHLLKVACKPVAASDINTSKVDSLLAECSIEICVRANQDTKSLAIRKQEALAATIASLLNTRQAVTLCKPNKSSFHVAEPVGRNLFLMGCDELSTLWHPPASKSSVPRIAKSNFRELEPPRCLPSTEKDRNVVALGRVKYRSERQLFGMDLEARRRHLYIIGKTGMGKSTLLQNILIDDIQSGRGVAVFDPHGDLANNTLNYIPKKRTNDVVFIDPSDTEYAIAFNPLQVHDGLDKTLVADGVLTAFQKVFGFDESQAPRMIHIFRNCLLSLVELPQASLLDVQRLLVDPMFRRSTIGQVSNPVVREFWSSEFGKWNPRDRTAFIASLQNKLGAFTTNEKLQRILGQPKGKLNLRRIMDEKKILIVNLSKGAIGENASNLLGTLLVTCLQQAAMSRANINEQQRSDYSIIIDEFQNYATPSIAVFLSEARKYRSHLVLSHQYTGQLPEEILDAVLGNCGNTISFQLGVHDSELFSKQFNEQVSSDELASLPKYHAYCRLLLSYGPSRTFSFATVNPRWQRKSSRDTIARISNSRWATKVK